MSQRWLKRVLPRSMTSASCGGLSVKIVPAERDAELMQVLYEQRSSTVVEVQAHSTDDLANQPPRHCAAPQLPSPAVEHA